MNTSGLLIGGVHRVSWADEAALLRERRAEWRVLCTRNTRDSARMTASQINRGVLYAFRPAGDFEARVDGNQVWARFLGDGPVTLNQTRRKAA